MLVELPPGVGLRWNLDPVLLVAHCPVPSHPRGAGLRLEQAAQVLTHCGVPI